MELKFLGAAGTVTGSGYLLTSGKTKVMIDFGMFQGTSAEEALNSQSLLFDPKEVNALFLTHAHLDHCGRLPLLTKHGFTGKIYATEPTLALTEIVLRDSAKIAKINNPHNPLYDEVDVENTLDRFSIIKYHEEFKFQNLAIKYLNAGHILGSASILMNDQKNKIIFSGDLGAYPDLLVPHTEYFENADYVVMESTYGGRTHPKDNPMEQLQKEINALNKKGDTLLIPSFAIHKTQALLYLISELKKKKLISRGIPVYLDSPMAIRVTDEYRSRLDQLVVDNFDFPNFNMVYKANKSRRLARVNEPKIIIAGSGMMHGGRILDHAKRMLNKGNTRLLFVGYQGVETLGREIKEGASAVYIDDKKVPVNAQVNAIETMSSHADEPRLIKWLGKIKDIDTLILTHGEDESRIKLASKIRKDLEISEVKLPQLGDSLDLSN